MPFNGSGAYTAPSLPGSWNPAVDDQAATSDDWNTLLTDLEDNGLSYCITKNGVTTVTADIPFNTHKLTGVATGTAATDAAIVQQVQRETVQYCADGSASGAAYVLTASPAVTSLTNGLRIAWMTTFANSAAPTITLNGVSAGQLYYADGSSLPAAAIPLGAVVTAIYGPSAGAVTAGFKLQTMAVPPPLWQEVSTSSGAVATGTTLIPWDDTIPQNTEGDEYMTRAITPKRTTNMLAITVTFNYAYSISDQVTVALFQDSTANALAGASGWTQAGGQPNQVIFTHVVAAGTVSATTFKVRAGGANAGTLTFNGAGGNRKLGGVLSSSIIIQEVSP